MFSTSELDFLCLSRQYCLGSVSFTNYRSCALVHFNSSKLPESSIVCIINKKVRRQLLAFSPYKHHQIEEQSCIERAQ